MPIEYAHALARSLKNVTDESTAQQRVDAFVDVLKRHGKLKALPAIVRELKRIKAREQAHMPTLVVAREKDADHARAEAAQRLDRASSDITVKVEDSLIGGWRYIDSDTLLDASYKAALLALHRRITQA